MEFLTLQVNRSNFKPAFQSWTMRQLRIFHLRKEFYDEALKADRVILLDDGYRIVMKDRRVKTLTRKITVDHGFQRT